jgi:hypothetical protein
MCIGFANNSVKIFPLIDETAQDFLDSEDALSVAKPKKRPLRKFDDHSG